MQRKIRMGMVGGGRNAFIGEVHRMAARLDGRIELVCGAFSSDAKRSRASGRDLLLPADRVYAGYAEMFAAEAKRPEADRMDFVSIVTPNHLHAPVAAAALKHGFHVMCDKPMTLNVQEARDLVRRVKKAGLLFGLTHNYTGYPMVKEARHRVRAGALGAIRKVMVEYPQGWLATRLEAGGQKQADWRTDPARAGASCCMGDIGTHAENLAEYVTGLRIEALAADLSSFVKGRTLDDDGSVLLRFRGGARGVLSASQVSVGEENGLRLRVYGEKGGLDWRQEEPNSLVLLSVDQPRRVLRAGAGDANLCDAAQAACRLPPGHPEGFIEAFANLYRAFAEALDARLRGEVPAVVDVPSVEDGLRGMQFIEAVVKSAAGNAKWVRMPAR